jgi:hypothetical protein
VIGHQAVGQQPRVMTRHRLGEDALDCGMILVALEDRQVGNGSVEDAVDQATLPRSSWSYHALGVTTRHGHLKNGGAALFSLPSTRPPVHLLRPFLYFPQ